MEIVVPGASLSHVFSDNLENPFIPRVLRSMKLGKEPAAMHLQSPSLLSKEWGGKFNLLGSITKDKYEKNRKEYRAKQKEITKKIGKLNYADDEYYLTSEYLLKLASNACKFFENSEVHGKRLLLKMALQNLELKGKKVRYGWIKPFDKIAFYASRQSWLPFMNNFRTLHLRFENTIMTRN